jgi:hypothetical protein
VAHQSTFTGTSFAGEGERTIIAASLTETERETVSSNGGTAEVTHFGIVSSSFLRFRHAAS